AFLSVLDKTHQPEGAIFCFTANGSSRLEDRFMSRCRVLRFNPEGYVDPVAAYLAQIWKKEGGPKQTPDFADVFRKSKLNIRAALMNVEMLLENPNYKLPDPVVALSIDPSPGPERATRLRGEPSPDRSAAARKAWETIRKRRAEGYYNGR